MEGQNIALIVIAVVVALMVGATTIYLLVAFQHPEDRRQAHFPKLVVCLSLFIAIITVLLYPLDVANRRACTEAVLFGECNFTLPMRTLWYVVYIVNIVLVYIVTPFTVFYYEADSDFTLAQRLKSAIMYTAVTAVVFGLVLGILYGVGGNVEYDTMALFSGIIPLGRVGDIAGVCLEPAGGTTGTGVFATFGAACSAFSSPAPEKLVWSVRPTFLVYVIACASILGWLLLMVFGGVGIVALPLDMIMRFKARPLKSITKSEYMQQAREIGLRAKTLSDALTLLKKEEQSAGRSRKWRKNARTLNTELAVLEDDQRDLEKHYPQGEDRDVTWVLYCLGFWFSLFGGIVFLGIGASWIVHIFMYLVTSPPLHPFLNNLFAALDDVFPLFGVAAFALWCFFLILAAIKGFTKLGLNFGFITLYPMRLGATMMSALLVNTALILLASTAVVQFCSVAFAAYAKETAIWEIMGTDIYQLSGVKYLFRSNVFIFIMMGFSLLTLIWILIRGATAQKSKKRSLEDIYAE